MKVKKLNENFELIEETGAYDRFVYYRDIDQGPYKFYFWNDETHSWSENSSEATIFATREDLENSAEQIINAAMKKFNKDRSEVMKYILERKSSDLSEFSNTKVIEDVEVRKAETDEQKRFPNQVTGIGTKDEKSVKYEDVDKIAEKDYREFANIDESFEITAENIDSWALNEAAVKNNIQSYDLKHVLLKEEKTIDQASRELEAEVARAESENQIDKVLDRSLKVAKRMSRSGDTSDFPNVLFESQAGFGKTDMIRQWAAKRGINLVERNLGTMGPEVFAGIVARDAKDPDYATRLGVPDLVNELMEPNSVLFLDEYNRSKTEIRGAVLTLIQNHKIWDPKAKGSYRTIPTYLFTIAAINPSGSVYKGAKEMDPAERSRFFRQPLSPDPVEHLKYLRSVYTRKIEATDDPEEQLEYRRKIALSEKILMSPKFTYDTVRDEEEYQDVPGYQPLNYRSFKLAMDRSDGTKEDFLDIWDHYCNFKKKHIIEDILGDYVDIEDKANDAIKDESESSVFKQEMNARAKLKKAFAELNI